MLGRRLVKGGHPIWTPTVWQNIGGGVPGGGVAGANNFLPQNAHLKMISASERGGGSSQAAKWVGVRVRVKCRARFPAKIRNWPKAGPRALECGGGGGTEGLGGAGSARWCPAPPPPPCASCTFAGPLGTLTSPNQRLSATSAHDHRELRPPDPCTECSWFLPGVRATSGAGPVLPRSPCGTRVAWLFPKRGDSQALPPQIGQRGPIPWRSVAVLDSGIP